MISRAALDLDPVPESAARARRMLDRLLAASGRRDWSEAAQLAISEVVTNVVLHAHTRLHVAASLSADELRVEVRDRNPRLPAHGPTDDGAITGRGMGLVAAVTSECGVIPMGREGKAVWFVLRDTGVDPGGRSPADLLARWDMDDELASPTNDGDRVVVLLRLPPMLWLAAREHHNAVLREYHLHRMSAGVDATDELALADQARNWVFTGVMAALADARATGTPRRAWTDGPLGELPDGSLSRLPDAPDSVDVTLAVPPDAHRAFQTMQDVLDAAERLAVAGRLLTRPALPEILAVRDWVSDQAVAQLAGVAPSPWPGSDLERFTVEVHDRAGVRAPEWDRHVVTDSDRGVVAADDANRILAVSRPLADALGWAVDDLVGRRVVAVIPPALREAHVAGFSRHLTTGDAHILGVRLRLPVLHADGRELPCDVLIEQAAADRGHAVYVAWITPVA